MDGNDLGEVEIGGGSDTGEVPDLDDGVGLRAVYLTPELSPALK